MKLYYGWIVVVAGALMGCVAIGTVFSLAVFLQPMAEATQWSRTGISSAMTIVFLSMGFASFGWGALTDRYGPMPVVLAGGVLLGLGLLLASRATSLLEFQLIYGIVVGAAAGAVFAPTFATITGWFEKHRGLAVSLVSAGMGVAPMTVSPFASWLITHHDWRDALLVIAILAWVVLVPTAFLVRRPPAEPDPRERIARPPGAAVGAADPHMTAGQALRSPQFWVLSLTYFCCCATHSGPIFHTVSYAVTCGIPMVVAVSIYSVEGLAGMFGRIGFGVAGDRFGAQRVLVIGLLAQAFGVLAYVFVGQLGGFYAVAVVVGFIYAGTMPLYAVIIRENFPLKMMGTIIGGTAMAGSLGMSTGPLLGGLAYDHFGSYAPMYVGSWGMGLAAMLILMTFRPFARSRTEMAVA
jgi:MFS family permease